MQYNNSNIQDDVMLSHNIDSWKSYTYIYDVAIDYLLKLHAPTIQDFQKVLSSEVASEQVIRSAFYSAFYTKQNIINKNNFRTNNNNNNNNNRHHNKNIEIIDENNDTQEIIEEIYVNQSWLDYFSSRIQYKSSNNIIFKVKRFKKSALEEVFGLPTSNGSKHKNEQYLSNNLFKKIKTENDPNLYFKPQDTSPIKNNNGFNDDDNYLRVEEDSDDSVLKYKYEKDFILVKDGKPLIITLSPDWGMPFHIKSEVQQVDTNIPFPQSPNNKNGNNKNNNNNNNKNNKNNNNPNRNNRGNGKNKDDDESWCGLM
ncbi:hypothetical protein DICPUDRAFT_97265 [Dictyostelium purpureum]|uniref:Uncharacterized protein n=1 Tax=Dictyostelium purpureum TaxID=5786 RepID=F0ZF80_DICPU|nr:uncharacterized protein DICPUDRAFT_97265 [Dictyostelium purpureum]EGC37406.1 hypothetical protein DICPUDRAFT_97265 [Dictyostelium purpureum]|eukprot:XP_003286059.1 hypothetical protein DICPUDRAFT_97265 [Dictyostelium purpureum]